MAMSQYNALLAAVGLLCGALAQVRSSISSLTKGKKERQQGKPLIEI
jgi:hypothetical protein